MCLEIEKCSVRNTCGKLFDACGANGDFCQISQLGSTLSLHGIIILAAQRSDRAKNNMWLPLVGDLDTYTSWFVSRGASFDQDPGTGLGDRLGGRPGQVGQALLGLRQLGGADQEDEASGGGDQVSGDGKDVLEAFDCAKGDDVERFFGEGFGAGVLYIDVRQCKGAGDLAKECRFFLIGLDQGEGDLWHPEFDGDAGESGAGADVGQANLLLARGLRAAREEVAGGEEAFTEVAGDDVFRVADGGEVDPRIPVGEYIDVSRYMVEIIFCQGLRRVEERMEKFGDVGQIHEESRL